MFSDWAHLSNDPDDPNYDPEHDPASDPYEGEAGPLIQQPFPISGLQYCEENEGVSGPYWEDREGYYWAKAAGDDGGPATITMQYYYPVQPGFYFPGATPPAEGAHVPWLDNGSGVPVDVTYTITWPDDVPTMKVGQTVIGPAYGIDDINGQCSVDVIYQQSVATGGGPSVILVDPVQAREVSLTDIPVDVDQTARGSDVFFPELSLALRLRVAHNTIDGTLRLSGLHVDPITGFEYALMNVMSARERDELLSISESADAAWQSAVNALYDASRDPVVIEDSSVDPYDVLALTSGFAQGVGYVTLARQNAEQCRPLGISLQIIKVVAELEPGNLLVITPDCPFDETLTIRHANDFGGRTGQYAFEWKVLADEDGTAPADPPEAWDTFSADPPDGLGAVDITIKGPGLMTLRDNWFVCRYQYTGADLPWTGLWSDWTPPQFAPGWIKRVVGGVNPFDQRATGGGIEGAENSFFSYADTEVNTIVSMIGQAGPRWTGDVPMNCLNLDDFGLIEIYETVLGRGKELSIDGIPPVDYEPANNALLLVGSRVADLYLLLGNEAYADAADPTIAFGTDDGTYGTEASSIHCFMNQTSSLLEEELALLRGRDNTLAPDVSVYPLYNRLPWNFTNGQSGGEVAYALNYDILDQNGDPAGQINEGDAAILYPQGHGDAWGHYLTAVKTYYDLLKHPNYTWKPRSEGVLVGGQPVTVDYLDERKFASAAAAKARAGAELVNLTYRAVYVEDPAGQWQGYKDSDPERAWGFAEWSARAGFGTYLDWVTGNALLPAEDPDHTGIQKIDRTTVLELRDVASRYQEIQSQTDTADLGLNPLGLAANVIPFDISPSQIDQNKTHFEQIYERAAQAMNNAIAVFDHANNSTQLLRRQADTQAAFERNVDNQEADFKSRLIESFGYPYSDDIGPGATYPTGYDGPDLYHFTYVDPSELMGIEPPPVQEFTVTITDIAVLDDGSLSETAQDVTFHLSTSAQRFGLIKPPSWTGQRRAPGEIQLARSDLIQARARFERGLNDYDNLILQIEEQAALAQAQFALDANEIQVLNTQLNTQKSLDAQIRQARRNEINWRNAANDAITMGNAIAEALPQSVGLSTDATSAIRSGIRVAGSIAARILNIDADNEAIAELEHQQAAGTLQAQTNITLTTARAEFTVLQQVAQLEQLVRQEAGLRLELYTLQEAVQQASGRYLAALARAQRLLDDRSRFRRQTAADVQVRRYKDMAFRIFRNDALQKYRAQFDLAARYVYLAAKAYDYETTLLSSDQQAGERFLTDIVRARLIGKIQQGQPLTGAGLADPMARMAQNFQVLGGQLGFTNPQTESDRFSLRSELFRIQRGSVSDAVWRETLRGYVVPNLLDVPEFRRHAIFEPDQAVEPGIVIPFSTTINYGMNLFAWPLGGGDSAYNPGNFATKVRSVGVWFSNYNNLGEGMATTPYVFLIPVGSDILRSPGTQRKIREFTVLDQLLPAPFPVNPTELSGDAWTPWLDTLGDSFAAVRRHAAFKAYHDSGLFRESEVEKTNSRLIGRSVWNTQWLLVIPAVHLSANRDEALNRFIDGALIDGERDGNGVKDILLFFQTYAYSGTK